MHENQTGYSRRADKIALGLCGLAIAYCIAAPTWRLGRVSIDVAPLPRLDPTEAEVSGTGFTRNDVYPKAGLPLFTGNVKLYASFASPMPLPASAHTAWYRAVPHFSIFMAGYPSRFDNRLFVEVQTERAGIIHLRVPPELIPGDGSRWWLRNFYLPEHLQPLKFRIVAVAVPKDSQGWIGFSEPFVIRSVDNLAIVKQLLWCLTGTAAAIVAFLSPGLTLRSRRRNLNFIWVPLPGIVLLALIGLSAWIGPRQLSPAFISRVGLFGIVAYATYHFIRFGLSGYTSSLERQVLLVFLLLVSIGVAKTIYSLGPSGELFAARASRTYEVGARSDSRFPYHVIQLARFREHPFGPFAKNLYEGWSFSHRGPTAGLAAAPFVLSLRAAVPHAMPDQPWWPFDPEGFEAYRLAMIVLACCGLLTVFGVAQLFLPPAWAFFAFLISATAPFTIHEIYYTWPKLAAAGFVLAAAYLVFKRQYGLSGLTLGFGYLVHPAALLSFPALIGIAFLQRRKCTKRYPLIDRMLAMAGGIAAWLLFWRLVNHGHYEQGSFSSYFYLTGGINPPTMANWFRSRIDSVLNTLVPLNLILFHRQNLEIQSIYEFSPPVIQFFFVYWNTLPFGAGIAFFLCGLLRLLYVGYRRARSWFLVLLVIPFALFVPYWGWSSSGLLREGLHAWFLGLLIFAVVVWRRFLGRSGKFLRLCNWTLLFSGVETLCVLLVPTIASQHLILEQPFVLSDTVALVTMFVTTVALYLFTFRFAERLRHTEGSVAQQDSHLEELTMHSRPAS